jgi:hypothetical protein
MQKAIKLRIIKENNVKKLQYSLGINYDISMHKFEKFLLVSIIGGITSGFLFAMFFSPIG